jgi:RimJ/RimL family protein N-acetyltransferase
MLADPGFAATDAAADPVGSHVAPIVRTMKRDSLNDGVVVLRPWQETDATEIVACVNGDPEISRWLDRVPQPYTLEDADAYIQGLGEEAFAITDAETGRLLGAIGFRPLPDGIGEIGYWLRSDVRGRGLTTRALSLLSRSALEHDGVARVQLRADVENTASCRVAESAGFCREGVLRSAHWNPRLRRRQDWVIYSLLPGDLA